jgi:acyl-CoA thioester hydrolase
LSLRVSEDSSAAVALAAFPVTLRIAVAWGEMDAYGHVNNAVFFRYFESARIAYFDAVGFRDLEATGGVGPILASTHCRFRRPLFYPDVVHVGARVSEIAADRFTMEYRLVSTRSGEIAADGGGVIVAYEYAAQCKALLPESVRQRIELLESVR